MLHPLPKKLLWVPSSSSKKSVASATSSSTKEAYASVMSYSSREAITCVASSSKEVVVGDEENIKVDLDCLIYHISLLIIVHNSWMMFHVYSFFKRSHLQ